MENTQGKASFMLFEERDDIPFVRLRDKASCVLISAIQAPLPLFAADCNMHCCHDAQRLELIIIIFIITTVLIHPEKGSRLCIFFQTSVFTF